MISYFTTHSFAMHRIYVWVLALFILTLSTPLINAQSQVQVQGWVPQDRILETAIRIVSIMDRIGMKMWSFISILDSYQTRFEDGSTKALLVDQLQNSVLDTFYRVEDFATCIQYNDGCNICEVDDEFNLINCTERQCIRQWIPTCEERR